MDELREAALLQAFGQQDPLVAYKRQGYDMFQQFQVIFRKNVVHQIFHVLFQPTASHILEETRIAGDVPPAKSNGHATDRTAHQAAAHSKRSKGRERSNSGRKIGRNEPCYCGSGKKFKHCHGRV
jgi:preprotein translocase subunit SecA